MQTTELPLAEMLNDVSLWETSRSTEKSYAEIGDDLACHVRALIVEVGRLQLYERAMQSMAAQFICPKKTAEELARQQLGEDA